MKEGFLEKAARKLEMPAEVVAGLPRVEIKGCREVYIENHRGLLLYEQNEMHVNGGQVVVKLTGQGFVIKAMNATELRVEGLLFGVEFEY